MNVFFIGMGYMGVERLKTIQSLKKKYDLKIVGFYDPNVKKIKLGNLKFKSTSSVSAKLLKKNKISLCIISTPHNLIIHYVKLSLKSNPKINLVIEKPLGLNFKQAKRIIYLKKRTQKIFVGLNYRYFNGISKMIKDINGKKFGRIKSLQINFGHGHNPEILKSWKLKKKFAGGGVILDPGIHILNLIQLFCSNIKIEYVKRLKGFWKTGVEEEATIILSSKEIPIINISLSITKWRSTFQINGNGYRGYWRLDGRGRSYGNQTYIVGKRWGWLSGKKQKYTEKILSNSKEDKVFFNEMNSILKKIKSYKTDTKLCDEKDAIKTMKLIKDIYAF